MNKKYKEAFDTLAAKMDDREKTIKLAIECKNHYGYLPDKFKYLEKFFNEKPWRKDKMVLNAIKRAAKAAAKNA